MKEKIIKIIYEINYSFLLRNIILMESNPDLSDNTKAVYDEMLKKGINEKYKIVWLVDDKDKFKNIKEKNVIFIERNKFNLKYLYYRFFAKYIVDCNKFIKKVNRYQFRLHLTHGAVLKIPKNYVNDMGEVDYILQPSDLLSEIFADSFNVDKKLFLSVGFPRNDVLFKKCSYFNKMFKQKGIEKLIVWMPTFRNHKNGNNSENKTDIHFSFGVPTIENEKQLNKLNNLLVENKVRLIIKLHPAEDTSKLNNLDLSNITLIKDNLIFEKENLTVYHLLSIADALITDYSSIYYDYLLTDKPIGLAVPDIKEYSSHVALAFDDYEKNVVGEYIYKFNDLMKFIQNVIDNNDVAYEKRMEKKKIYHNYPDNKSAQRVLDFLVSKMKEDNKSNT